MTNQCSSSGGPAVELHAGQRDRHDGWVLVIDDDPIVVHPLRGRLADEGCRLQTASRGADALELMRPEPPGVVIVNSRLPDVDGIELCRRMHAEAGTGFVYLIVVAHPDEPPDRRLTAFEAGVDDYLSKPFDPRELIARVRVGQRIARIIHNTRRQGQGVARHDGVEAELATCRHHLEHMVEQRSRELLAAQRQILQHEKLASVGQLAAGIAHEINTPIQYVGDNLRALSDAFDDLTALVGRYHALFELVKAGPVCPEEVEQLTEAEREHDLDYILEDTPKAIRQGLEGVERVAHIVRAMKDFSHVDRGELSRIDVNRALESTLAVARNEYKYVADVVTELGELPPVACYASELNQVFLNLVVNAAHAIQDTGRRGTITIRTRRDGDGVEIAVTDTGTGIAPEIRDRIFDPFFTTKEVGKGTGQGLSIAHQSVVGRHGGTLTFESEVGRGTTFIVRLPLEARKRPTGNAEGQPG